MSKEGLLMPVVYVSLASLGIFTAWSFLYHCYWTLSGLLTYQLDTMPEIAVAILGVIFPPFGGIHGACLTFGWVAWGV